MDSGNLKIGQSEKGPLARLFRAALALGVFLAIAASATAQQSQDAGKTDGVVHVLGLEGIPRNAKGSVTVTGGVLRFERGGTGRDQIRFELSLALVDDVFTADDSQRVVRGTLQTLSTFAPYGGGRFLSLFRHKIDLLTIQYRDSAGARHGVILTLPDGKALEVKKQMVAAGAKASVSIEESEAAAAEAEKQKEKKP